MTLPSTIQFPSNDDVLTSGDPVKIGKYIRELTFTLQRMYEDLAQNINGDIRGDFGLTDNTWTPTLKGSTSPGAFTYVHQVGYYLRRGLMTDIWFNIEWSASGGATGNLVLELPYKVAKTTDLTVTPFIGTAATSGVTYPSGTAISIAGRADTFDAEFITYGSAVVSAIQGVVASGTVIGHLRYIGQQLEF